MHSDTSTVMDIVHRDIKPLNVLWRLSKGLLTMPLSNFGSLRIGRQEKLQTAGHAVYKGYVPPEYCPHRNTQASHIYTTQNITISNHIPAH